MPQHQHLFRIRYGETDQMGTYSNARVLEWFEVGRTELSRSIGLPYAEWERRGVFLPVIEAHFRLHGRAKYDDLLEMTTAMTLAGGASLRFDVAIRHAEGGRRVASGHTIHAIVDTAGRPIRAPEWVTAAAAGEDTGLAAARQTLQATA